MAAFEHTLSSKAVSPNEEDMTTNPKHSRREYLTFVQDCLSLTVIRCKSFSFTLSRIATFPVGKKTSAGCLKDVLPKQARHLAKTSYRCPKDILNANLKDIFVRQLEETFARYIADVLQKTSQRCLINLS